MNAIARLRMASLGDALVRRFPPLYLAYRRDLAAFDALDTAGRQVRQQRLVDRVLAAASGLPGYSACKGKPLDAYPILTKEMLRAAPDDYRSPSGLLTAAAATSGSSGIPLAIKRSFASVVFEQAAIDHVVALAGGDFRNDRIAVLRGEAIKAPSDRTPPYWRVERGGRIMNFSVAHLNAETAETFFKALKDFAPGVIWAYPSALDMLAACMERQGWRLDVPVVLTSSEVLTDELRARAEQLFGACVADYYGQAERVSFAYALKAAAYRFMPAYGQVELHSVDGDGRFRIISTNLRNAAQPLVRYDTGDIAIALDAQDAAEVALGTKPFARIEGRESDYLIAPDGSRLIGMNHIPRSIDGLLQMQLRQTDPDRVLVLAVAERPTDETLKAAIAAKVAQRLPQTMRVEIRFCEAIAREKSGKMPLVVRESGLCASG
ncbi:MAG TPA: hypothetical protein VGN93_23870 [Shinella sp.]|jgi:phenylacetate-coenzyme A ligase PaaK-like adenylate-forming protein|uniref:hypothetical protein n=1 Tax=Shinella sp. TaxID=1870904 RepID=UPI002E0D2551|nr:hypothetical protein [Shinella sp.]